jgi:hypothetical protein
MEKNVEVQIGLTKPNQYTFMAWNKTSLELYLHGYGKAFSAFLTWWSRVDKLVLDLMRPLHGKGLQPEAYASTLLELHSKKYFKQYLWRERMLLALANNVDWSQLVAT